MLPSEMRNPAVMPRATLTVTEVAVELTGCPPTDPTNRPTAGTLTKFQPQSVDSP